MDAYLCTYDSEDPKKHLKTKCLMTKSPTIASETPDILWIRFKCGFPVNVSNEKADIMKDKPLEMFEYLNDVGHGGICF
ncbi:hypothetical protein CHUAL_011536 [Chamberlinius hualienensis]